MESLLQKALDHAASDLLLVANEPPTIYVDGRWHPLSDESLSAESVAALVDPILTSEHRHKLISVRDLDMGLSIQGLGRYRVNIHYQRGTLAAAIRAIPEQIPAFDSLGLPQQVLSFADYPNGLVLVTGGTGQGKSTTLAALIDHMNRCGPSRHIITIEDPVEFAFQRRECIIEQRQIGDDSPSFASALRHVLRQRPDVILIGELRDLETMSSALTAAETGHLVLATLHTCNASQTIARMIDVFPAGQQGQVRAQLAASLRAILCQSLLRDQLNESLVPATELLIATSAIRRAIRDNEAHLIHSMIETGRRAGMHTLEQSLAELVVASRISAESAILASVDPVRMKAMLVHSGSLDMSAADLDAAASSRAAGLPWVE
ncbi:MAG: PilT/PilU family type 4a pilus ATPase [Phycisphaerae bacterium]|nr:PilT/PilU family type 4a pilus ATPase [Phycisphaerae bacterium]